MARDGQGRWEIARAGTFCFLSEDQESDRQASAFISTVSMWRIFGRNDARPNSLREIDNWGVPTSYLFRSRVVRHVRGIFATERKRERPSGRLPTLVDPLNFLRSRNYHSGDGRNGKQTCPLQAISR